MRPLLRGFYSNFTFTGVLKTAPPDFMRPLVFKLTLISRSLPNFISFVAIIANFISISLFAQSPHDGRETGFYNKAYWEGVADKRQLTGADRQEFLESHYRAFKEAQSKEHRHYFHDSELVWVTTHQGKFSNTNSVLSNSCINMDFEEGTLNGWTRSTGFHPLFNAIGCCTTANGAQAIMTGAGTDIYGGFPVVFPGGNFSVRLGNNQLNGVADRLEQTFLVTPQNANFTYRYAVVLNDQGHPVAQQPAFTIEMVDSTGFQVPCTMYTVAAASNIAGFFTSTVTGGSPLATVVYKPWTTVALDLTPNIGQNVTIRFTTYDCSQGGHFGYAYIDGSCASFETSHADTTCPGIPKDLCAPPGFGTYSWSGPGFTNTPTRCISTDAAGVYTCFTILSPGCPGPTFTYTLTLLPNPVLSFTPVTTGACATAYTFASTSSIVAGSISSYNWDFGDGNSTFLISPGHNYPAFGTYSVEFKAYTDRGCRDSVSQTIQIHPFPVVAFSPPSNCVNTVIQFTNTSNIPSGSITSYSWNLGNGVVSNATNPTNTYTSNGTYNVTLAAQSDQGCVSVGAGTLGIFPPPVVNWSATNFCFGNATAFTNSSTIVSGVLVGFEWDFGDGAVSTASAPIRTYTAPGSYLVSFTATSNHSCKAMDAHSITIHPLPTPSFAANPECLNIATSFTNLSTIQTGYTINSYTWNLGGGAISNAVHPLHTYSFSGTQSPTLTAVSNEGCVASLSKTITVHPRPILSFNPPGACQNTVIQFTNTSTVATGSIISFFWDFGDGQTTNSINPIYSYSTSGSFTVQLTAVSDQNCQSSANSTLSIHPLPVTNFAVSGFCENGPTTFTNSSTISGGSIPFYTWNFGNGQTSGLTHPVNTYTAPGAYNVSLTAFSNFGCETMASQPIVINPRPVVSFSAGNSCPSPGSQSTFTNATTIFGGGALSYTWSYGDSQTSNLFSSPHTYSIPGTYIVTLTANSPMGCRAEATNTLIVYNMPVIAFSPPSACANTAISFTNTSFVLGGSMAAFSWSLGNAVTSTVTNPVHTYTIPNTYMITLQGISNQGCASTQTANLTIYPNPTASFTYSNVCHGGPTAFSASAAIASGSISLYTWNFGDGSGTIGSNTLHTYANSNVYTVNLTVISDNNCVTTNSTELAIYPLPQISFVSNSVCQGGLTLFTNNSTLPAFPPSSIAGYTWNFGGGSPTSNVQHAQNIYGTSGTHTTQLTVISNQGCVNTATGITIVHPNPVVAFTPSSACVNSAINFTNTTQVATGSVTTFQWALGDGNTSNAQHPVHTYTAHNVYNITLTAISDQNCPATGTRTLAINPYPTGTVVPLQSNACVNGQIAFDPNVIIASNMGSSIASYTWNFGDSQFQVINSSTLPVTPHTYTSYGQFNVVLTANSSENCINTFSTFVNIYPNPSPAFASSRYCFGDTTTFFDQTPALPTGTFGYVWHLDDGNSGSTQPNPRHVYTSTGTKSVVLTATSMPQPGLTCSNSAVQIITINALPAPSFTAPSVCHGVAMQFTNLTNPSDITNWNWYFTGNGVLGSAFINPSHTYPSPGNYTVMLTARNTHSCTASYTMPVTVFTNPVPMFSVASVCEGQPLLFINQSTPGSGSTMSYSWTFGSGGGSSVASPVYTLTPAGNYTAQLRATSDLGCSTTTTGNYQIYHNPNIFVNADPVCDGKPMQFANLSTVPNGSLVQFFWDYENNGVLDSSYTGIIQPHIYPRSGGFYFRLQAISDRGCTSTTITPVEVYESPKADFISGRVCAGDNVLFSSLSSSADGSLTTYEWDFNGDNRTDKTGESASFTFSLTGEVTAKLTVTSEYGCSHSMSRFIYANPKPVPAYSSDRVSGCPPVCVNLKDLSTISSGSFVTRWNLGDLSPEITASAVSNCFKTGIYDLKMELVSDSGCRATLNHPGYLRVYSNPEAGFVVSPAEVDEEEPQIQVESHAKDATSTMYFINDGSNINKPEFAHTFKLDGKTKPIIVQVVKNEYGCTDTTFKMLDIKPAFTIYFPNTFTPNADYKNDGFLAKGVGILSFALQIYDRWGHRVFSTNDITEAWDGTVKGSADAVKQDVYTWKAQVTDVMLRKHEFVGHVTLLR